MIRSKVAAGALAAVTMLAGLGVGAAHAQGVHPASVPAETKITLPLLGAQVNVTLTTGPGGNLQTATIDPSGDFTAVDPSASKVVWEHNTEGAKVVVRSSNNTQSVSARAGSLADISGDGHWEGDVFGTGVVSMVDFTIGDAGDGTPTIDPVTPTVTGDITAEVGDQQVSTDDDEDGMEVKVRRSVTFQTPGASRTLTISVKLEGPEAGDDDEDSTDGSASLRITLGRTRGEAQALADVVGPQQWTGTLCSGDPATIDYTVGEDGTLTLDGASPDAELRQKGDQRFEVRWSTGERVRISAKVDGDQITINVNERIRCDGAAPEVNTATTTSDDHEDGDDHDGDHHDGDGDHHGGDGQDD